MLAYALPLSFFLVLLETALGSYIVLFFLDAYGDITTARLLVADRAAANTKAAAADEADSTDSDDAEQAEEDADEESQRHEAERRARRRVGVTKGFLVFQGLLYLALALLT